MTDIAQSEWDFVEVTDEDRELLAVEHPGRVAGSLVMSIAAHAAYSRTRVIEGAVTESDTEVFLLTARVVVQDGERDADAVEFKATVPYRPSMSIPQAKARWVDILAHYLTEEWLPAYVEGAFDDEVI